MSANPDLQAGLITKHKEGDQEVITHTGCSKTAVDLVLASHS